VRSTVRQRRSGAAVLIVLLGVLLSAGRLAAAADPGAAPSEPPAGKAEGCPVLLDGKPLFYIRTNLRGSSAEDRARHITARVGALAENPAVSVDSITAADFEIPITDIMAGDSALLTLVDADAAPEGRTRQELAKEYAATIRAAVEQYREAHRWDAVARRGALSLGAVLVLIAALYLTRYLGRWAEARLAKRIHALRFHSVEVVRAESMQKVFRGLRRAARAILVVAFLYA
jgi:hypothetical protein